MTPTQQADRANTNQAGFTRTIHIQAAPNDVDDAVTTVPGIQGWRSRDTAGDGGITVRFGGGMFQTLRLAELTRGEHAAREWTAQSFPIEGTPHTDEWVGTNVSFDIQAHADGSSLLVFAHRGLTPRLECYGLCNAGWTVALASLQRFVEDGAGTPSDPTA